MGSEEQSRAARQRVPVLYFAPVIGVTAVVLVWLALTTPHMLTDSETVRLMEVSQIEVERHCNTELANVLVIQKELWGLAQHFDNIKVALGPSAQPARHLLTTPTSNHHRLPSDFAPSPSGCPAKLSTALTTMSSWLGALHTEVLALQRSSQAAHARAAADTAALAAARSEADAARAELGHEKAKAAVAESNVVSQEVEHAVQELEAARADKAATEKALTAAREARARADKRAQDLQRKLDSATSAAVPQPQPLHGSSCWIADKNDGVLVNRTVLRGSPVYVDHVRQSMVLPLNDEWVANWIATTESPFDTPILLRMLQYIKGGDVVLDIGANLGTYSIWFARQVGAAGSVWSFEPQPYVYQVLCANAVINGHRNIRTINAALSFRPGMASMDSKVPDGTSKGKNFAQVTTNHTTKVNYGGRRLGVGGEKVPMLMLDALKLPKVSFVKIDVQGAEPLVIWGMRETIRRTLPVINYEASWGYKVTPEMVKSLSIPEEVANFDISAWLKSLGYTFVERIQEDQFWIPPNWVPPTGWQAPRTPPPK